MSCPSKESFSLYLDNELSPVEREEFERHLKTCAACQAELLIYLQIHKVITDGTATVEKRVATTQLILTLARAVLSQIAKDELPKLERSAERVIDKLLDPKKQVEEPPVTSVAAIASAMTPTTLATDALVVAYLLVTSYQNRDRQEQRDSLIETLKGSRFSSWLVDTSASEARRLLSNER